MIIVILIGIIVFPVVFPSLILIPGYIKSRKMRCRVERFSAELAKTTSQETGDSQVKESPSSQKVDDGDSRPLPPNDELEDSPLAAMREPLNFTSSEADIISDRDILQEVEEEEEREKLKNKEWEAEFLYRNLDGMDPELRAEYENAASSQF